MGPLLLFITTFIWGTAFLAQKIGGESFGPFTLTCLRSILGGVFLLICIAVRHAFTRNRPTAANAPLPTEAISKPIDDNRSARDSRAQCCTGCARGSRALRGFEIASTPNDQLPTTNYQLPTTNYQLPTTNLRHSLVGGAVCGVPLFVAILSQQIGIQYTTPGISAFLTTNYVLFVPLVLAVFTRRLPRPAILACALVALGGTYLICIAPGAGLLSIGRGEAWTILCAFLFALQMIAIDRYAKEADLLVLSAAQLFACAALAAPFMLLPGEANPITAGTLDLRGALSLLYVGVFSSGIAYTMQTFGQARTNAALAAVICSMESVFGALSGWIVLGDTLAPRQLAGCALVFCAALAGSLRRE